MPNPLPNAPLGPKKIVGKPLERPARTAAVQSYLPEIARGLGITMSHFFKNVKELSLGQRNDPVLEGIEDGVNTISYPEQKRPYPARFRGVHRLTHRDDGSPRCVACGFCVEACPCDAIRMDTGIHAAPYDSREQFIYEKDLLMAFPGRDGAHASDNPRHEPGDPTHPGVSRLKHH